MGAGIENRIAELKKRHEACDTEIRDLGRFPCSMKERKIKRRKLELKEEIANLERQLAGEQGETRVEFARLVPRMTSMAAESMAAE
jgi:hypothetical protein